LGFGELGDGSSPGRCGRSSRACWARSVSSCRQRWGRRMRATCCWRSLARRRARRGGAWAL